MARHFKSNSWAPRLSASAGSVYLGRSDEAAPRSSLVPVPVLVVGFKSTGIALTGLRNPGIGGQSPSRPPPPAAPADPPPVEESAANAEPRAKPEPATPGPETESEAEPAKERRTPPGQGDSIDLIIDKLPRHALVKPIPVTISPLGDRVFIASTPDLDITVTGNSLSDALLLLKQQLESTYESLRGKASGREEERQLKRLRDYIRDH